MKLQIQTGTDNPVLRKVSTAVKPSELHEFRTLGDTMLRFIKNPKNAGIGLAAPQVGINRRVIVAGLPKNRDDESYPLICMINPVICEKSNTKDVDTEGCLSLPGITGPVERSTSIVVEWIDTKGKKFKKELNGYGARVVQHEVDHLDGILITDKFIKAL